MKDTIMQYLNNSHYNLIDDYIYPENLEEWKECPYCNAKPKIWIFDNGRYASCKCHNSKYDCRTIQAESLNVYYFRNGSWKDFNSNELRDNWNKFCEETK